MVSSPPTRIVSEGDHTEQSGLYYVLGGGETIATDLGKVKSSTGDPKPRVNLQGPGAAACLPCKEGLFTYEL